MTGAINHDTVYSDIMANLDLHPTRGDLVRSVNEAAVKRSLRMLLLTNPGERPFRPLLGSGIRRFLFEPMHSQTEHALKREIERTISNYEPRVKLISVQIKANYDHDTYNVKINFYILNRVQTTTLDLTLERIR